MLAEPVGSSVSVRRSSPGRFVPSPLLEVLRTRGDSCAGGTNRVAAMSVSGDLRTMPLADVLSFANARPGGGILTVESHQGRKEIRLAAGRIVSCTSGGVKERLGQRLIARERIGEPVLIAALAEQDQEGGLLGDILVRRRLVDGVALEGELNLQGQASLADLFTWDTGSFTFAPVALAGARPLIEATCTDVILSGCARADRARRIRALGADRAARFRIEPNRYPPGFPRNKLELGLIHLVLQGLGAAEICLHRHEEDFTVLSTLTTLVEEGVLFPVIADEPVTVRSCSEILRDAATLTREGAWERALGMLRAGLHEHGDDEGLGVALTRLRMQSREKLSWAGGLDVVPVLSPQLQDEGTASLAGAERVVAMRVDGARPLRAIVRASPVDEDVAHAAFLGLFERGLLHLTLASAREPVAAAATVKATEQQAAPRTRGWEPPPRAF